MRMKKTVLLLATAALAVLLTSGVYVLGAVDAHAISPLTDKIVWSGFSPDNDSNDIYMMNTDGSNQTRLTTTTAVSESKPAISPDGTKIAYTRSTDPDVFNNDDIYVMNTDGSNQTRLTSNPGNDQSPDWSPDGKRIVFHNCRVD